MGYNNYDSATGNKVVGLASVITRHTPDPLKDKN